MAEIRIISPIDQPLGNNRLLQEFRDNLNDDRFNQFNIIVAFAKSGPLLKLYDEIVSWNKRGTIDAIFGIDSKVTSIEALNFAIDNFHSIKVVHAESRFNSIFHPKIYLFQGSKNAVAYIGSNNLTTGGTETNFESYVQIIMDLPDDQATLDNLLEIWESCEQYSVNIDSESLELLIAEGRVLSEKELKKIAKKVSSIELDDTDDQDGDEIPEGINFPKIRIVPPSPLPKSSLKSGKKVIKEDTKEEVLEDVPVSGLVMHIVPHHNGEVFLSKLAINQNASFFGWPFTGRTVPKKATNPSYPQREPDPKINIRAFDNAGDLQIQHNNFDLNTVYYEAKSEIRITVPQDIVQFTQDHTAGPYPIMLLSENTTSDEIDYQMDIFLPGSEQYEELESVCNQSMPSGGKPVARRFGWL